MSELAKPFQHIQGVLTKDDISSLKKACKSHLSQEEAIPSYTLIDSLNISAVTKIKCAMEEQIGEPLYYLNDFYIYTDETFGTSWHMDTELFTFEHALNAWILLSPDRVTDPLCFIDQLNDAPERYFHSLQVNGDDCTFTNFCSKIQSKRSLTAIEQEKLHTPTIEVGDILLINPRRFHKTNTCEPKHCLAIKFVYKGLNGFLSAEKVPSLFWPEVGIFNKLVKQGIEWDSVLEGLRDELKSSKGRKALSAGFYPEKIELYKRMAQTL